MIFSQLLKPDLRSLMLVCKQWANNTVGLLWGCARSKDNRLVWRTLASPKPFFNYCSMVKSVCLDNNVTDDKVLSDAKFRIMALRLFNCRLTETGFAPIAQDITSLRSLNIFAEYGNAGTYIRTIADRCAALQTLRICCCEASLSTLSKSCKSLREDATACSNTVVGYDEKTVVPGSTAVSEYDADNSDARTDDVSSHTNRRIYSETKKVQKRDDMLYEKLYDVKRMIASIISTLLMIDDRFEAMHTEILDAQQKQDDN
ncbi:hypothetical protein ACQRIU_001322 [Beauveria bassiana]